MDGIRKSTSVQPASRLGDGNGNETVRLNILKALQQMVASHSWVDEHDNGSRLEEGERQRDKINARFNHQHDAMPRLDTDAMQAGGKSLAIVVQLTKCDRVVVSLPLRSSLRVQDVGSSSPGPGGRHRIFHKTSRKLAGRILNQASR